MLKGAMLERLHTALLDAYPSRASLEQLVLFRLDCSLNEITEPGSHSDVVFQLLRWAAAHGKIEALLNGALERNPSNPTLATAVWEFRAAQTTSPKPIANPAATRSEPKQPPVAQTVSQPAPVAVPPPSPTFAPSSFPISRRNLLWGAIGVGAVAVGTYALERFQAAKKVGITKTNATDGAEMAWIPAGTFQMGSNKNDDEKPVHAVTLSGFWLYKTPVTVAQFRKYDQATGNKYYWNGREPNWGWQDAHPMVNVSWTEAEAYAKWARVVLPTEAQWEYAARGGLAGKEYPWGDEFDRRKLCCSEKEYGDAKSPAAVGSYAANGYGLYDMAGNVWEWCADWYDKEYYKTSAAGGLNPTGPTSGTSRVRRGGSWYYSAEYFFRCAYRDIYYPVIKYDNVGFRCCASG